MKRESSVLYGLDLGNSLLIISSKRNKTLNNYTILDVLTRWLSAAVKILAILIISVANQVRILRNDSV